MSTRGQTAPDPGLGAAAAAGEAAAKSDESSVTQTSAARSDATSAPAADCSMATDTGGGDSPRDYNKLKYHSSKMELNLKILRDQMANLTSSGSSLSRQLASLDRNIQEIKDDDDEAGDADSEYESDDDQGTGSIKDAVDTEDDVNRMSDLEKDFSEPKFRRSVSTGSRSKKSKGGARDPNANEIGADGSQSKNSKASSRQESFDSCHDSDSECSQCLCCNSVASYSSTPWRYVSRGNGSTMDEDSDSSEYFSDESEYSTTSNMTSTDFQRRLSPFYNQSDRADLAPRGDHEEGRFDDAEPAADEHRMSPLGCETPKKYTSQPDLPSVSTKSESSTGVQSKSDRMDTGSDKPDTEVKSIDKEGQEEDKKEGDEATKASSLIGLFKAQESKAKQDEMASVAKAKRVEELRRKNSEIRVKNEQKRKAELDEKLKNKPKVDSDSAKSSPIVSENDDSEKVNIKDRITSFEEKGTTKDKGTTDKEEKPAAKSNNVERGTNTEPDSSQQMPDVIPDVAEEKADQQALMPQDDKPKGHEHKSHKSKEHKSKVAKTTIEIPVSCLPDEVIHPEAGTASNRPTMMTFQVKPGDVDAMGGPLLVARSPKPRRKMSKTIVRLSSTEHSPSSVSESTLVGDTDTVRSRGGANKTSDHSHHVCPHCNKSKKSGESKRVVKVLQLQPVPESPTFPSVALMNQAEGSTQIIQQHPSGRVIKMIPSRRHNVVHRQESSEDGVVFRFNMGMPENAPLQVGDYIRIPIQPQQQQPMIRHVQQSGGGGGVVIRTRGSQPRRQSEVITVRQSSSRPTGSPTSGVTVHSNQSGVKVTPSEGGGVRLVFGS